ncbi:MAG TPA: ATP-binding protein [Bryobacteraceae bacterium]|nr:ATP-binding protein [Bryobacteraceae bacterium]
MSDGRIVWIGNEVPAWVAEVLKGGRRFDPVSWIDARMPTAHLITGLPCSGKTTYATSLAKTSGGVLFSLDYWLITLHGRYSLHETGYGEHVRRVLACRQVISDVARELLGRGVDVVLDDGFFFREHRVRQIGLFQSGGARVVTHVVRAAPELLRARIERRNQNLPAHNLEIRGEMMERFVELWEEPSADEGAEVVVRISGV